LFEREKKKTKAQPAREKRPRRLGQHKKPPFLNKVPLKNKKLRRGEGGGGEIRSETPGQKGKEVNYT